MSWWRDIADRRFPDFEIGEPGNIYLRRWWLIPRNRFFNIYLHQFLRDDDDRALHDHPWVNASFLLEGRYIEHTIAAGGVNRQEVCRVGDFRLRRSRTAHRIELIGGQPCWSLFITGPRIREWGFHCQNGWVHWREFTAPGHEGRIGKGCDE